MRTLYSYPALFGVADNNPFGLKVYAFLRLHDLEFEHQHILDTRSAPRGQLPYLIDDTVTIGDSDAIIAYLDEQCGLNADAQLDAQQRNLDLLVRRTLDDLYWQMSYSRWRDERYWPAFNAALLETHPDITAESLEGAREYNRLRYHYQGIGRYEPDQVYARGMDNLRVVADLLGEKPFFFGARLEKIDATLYGFVANIYFYEIDTPLKRYVLSRPALVRHCLAIHERVGSAAPL
jgi:glutathione S-transferase